MRIYIFGLKQAIHLCRNPVTAILLALFLAGCGEFDTGGTALDRNDLSKMGTANITVKEHEFEVWLADEPEEQTLGLMNVKQEELTPLTSEAGQGVPDVRRGMLFVFSFEHPLSFWMHNTIIPLDIAYIRGDGKIVSTYTMAPLETRFYPSIEPARFALEVSAGIFAKLGIIPGDYVEIPDSMLKDQL